MIRVKLKPGRYICDAINTAFPEGLPVSDQPQIEINGSPCHLAEPETAEEIQALIQIAAADRAPVGLMMALRLHQVFPVDSQWIDEWKAGNNSYESYPSEGIG